MTSTAAERTAMAKLLSATDEAGAPLRKKILAEFEKHGISTRGGMIPRFLAHMNADEAPKDISEWVDEGVRSLRARQAAARPPAAEEQKPQQKAVDKGLLQVQGTGLQKKEEAATN